MIKSDSAIKCMKLSSIQTGSNSCQLLSMGGLMTVQLYTVSEKHIKYLKKFDNKVLSNHHVKQDRKYVGIGITLNEISYFIPLSSPTLQITM